MVQRRLIRSDPDESRHECSTKTPAITEVLRGDVVIDATVLDSPQWQRTGNALKTSIPRLKPERRHSTVH
jgi:hypothetical protein